jgi:hypothetical protein
LIVAVLLVFSFDAVANSKKLTRVGVYPLIKVKGGINTPDTLKTVLQEKAEDVKTAFDLSETGFLYPGFMEQVNQGAIEEIIVPKGQEIKWMVFRVGKKIKVKQDLIWAANKTLPAFALTVPYECKEYILIIPKPCGNLSLIEVRNSKATCDMKVSPEKANIGDTITVDLSNSKCASKFEVKVYHPEGTLIAKEELAAGNPVWTTQFKESGDYFIKAEAFNPDGIASTDSCEAKVYINFPPECNLVVEPTKTFVGNTVKMDASGSTDKDGKVVKADFTITDKKDGSEVETKSVTADPLIWERKFGKPGYYKISLKVADDFNAVSANNCEVDIEVHKRFFWVAEAGPMLARGTYTMYVFGRLGLAYFIVPDTLDIMVTAGGAINLGSDRFKSHFLSNLLLTAHFNAFYFGAGVGYTTKVRDDWDSGVDLVGNIGVDIFKNFNSRGSIFAELRVPLREGLSFDDAHEILVGFRLLF